LRLRCAHDQWEAIYRSMVSRWVGNLALWVPHLPHLHDVRIQRCNVNQMGIAEANMHVHHHGNVGIQAATYMSFAPMRHDLYVHLPPWGMIYMPFASMRHDLYAICCDGSDPWAWPEKRWEWGADPHTHTHEEIHAFLEALHIHHTAWAYPVHEGKPRMFLEIV
jgi:hypothetical protein